MKSILLALGLMALHSLAGATPIVNNSSVSETSEDSLTVAILSLDTLGNPAAADSFYVAVFGGGKANAFVFADSGNAAMTGLDTVRIGGQTFYYYSRKISDIDGAGASGYYSGALMAKSNSLALRTITRFSFQIVGWELDEMGDSTGLAAVSSRAALDTLDNGFASISPVTVAAINTDAITDASIANLAIDIDEFGGTYAPGQFETDVFTGVHLSDSWKAELWGTDTAAVSIGFGKTLKDFPQYRATGFSTFDPAQDSVFAKGGAVDSNRTELGGSGDSTAIARWVWNTPSANHTLGATFGDFLDAKVSSASGGQGAFSVTLVTLDTATAQVTPGASVAVFNVSQTSLLAIGASDNSGQAAFNLNADSFVVTVTLRGHIFPAYDTLVVAGTMTDSILGYPFDPGAPAAPDRVRAWGFVLNVSGLPDSGAVASAFLPSGVAQTTGAIIAPFAVSAVTDGAGLFELDLIPNSLLIPDTTSYEFTIFHTDGTILRRRLIAPDSTSWRVTW